MSIKTVQRKLADFRQKIADKNGKVTQEDKDYLQKLINEELIEAQVEFASQPTKFSTLDIPEAENDNVPLNKDQKYRLSLIEKTGTGSYCVH